MTADSVPVAGLPGVWYTFYTVAALACDATLVQDLRSGKAGDMAGQASPFDVEA